MNKESTNFRRVSGKIVDVVGGRIFEGTVVFGDSIIISVIEEPADENRYILPGLIDSHIHIESSMLVPSEFARLAVVHGTVGTVSDPHEIANVLGIPGVDFMIRNGKEVPFKFSFGAPSCVPATPFETAGAVLGVDEVGRLLEMDEIKYLSEMMNFPGVIYKDPEVMAKLAVAARLGKPVDGHAPGLTGEGVAAYVGAGISTDHECYTLDEALEKISLGMKVLIREGSAAKNFETLVPLIDLHPEMVMLCSDDKHPNDLVEGHVNCEVKRAIAMGFDPMKVIRCCTLNPVRHYALDSGLLQPGDPADFIVVDDLLHFNVLQTWINGNLVAEKGKSLISSVPIDPMNRFGIGMIEPESLEVKDSGKRIRVIGAMEGQLITNSTVEEPLVSAGRVISDTGRDILKIVVQNRYQPAPPAVSFIRGFGLQRGAIASSVAHDSHNIVAVGTDDLSLARAINMVIENKGGVAAVDGERKSVLALPVAGIMSDQDGFLVAERYLAIDRMAKLMGTGLAAPFMTLSFMALLVIPDLKLSDKGLFDGKKFAFTGISE